MSSTAKSTGRPPLEPGEVEIRFTVQRVHAPALRSVIEAAADAAAKKSEGTAPWLVEEAWTAGLIAINRCRAAVNSVVPEGDRNYV